jgi:N,N-dimethylformamidase
MHIVGYSDRMSVRQGERISFHVSTTRSSYTARLVRLRHGDTNPRGPGFRQELLTSEADGRYVGGVHDIHSGSAVEFGGLDKLGARTEFELRLTVLPTTAKKADQVIASLRFERADLSIVLSAGKLGLSAMEHGGDRQITYLDADCTNLRWAALAVSYEASTGKIELRAGWPDSRASSCVTLRVRASASAIMDRISLGANLCEGGAAIDHCYNGKIAEVALWASDEARPEPERLQNVCDWSMGTDSAGDIVRDTGSFRLHGRTFNRPTRGVTGPRFDGTTISASCAPEQYNAIHFHDDDLDDARWPMAFSFQVPEDLASGAYAFWLVTDERDEDYLPFFVVPRAEGRRAAVAFLAPTLSYLAYANYNFQTSKLLGDLLPLRDMSLAVDEHTYISQARLRSTYDAHSDGTGVSFAALKRPQLLAFRPKSRWRARSSPHQFGFDLYIIDWLMELGIEFDVVTDFELHEDRAEALRPYRVVISGSHAEYWTDRMLSGLLSYQRAGGNFMYLSGNGLYWVTALNEDRDLVEIRRPAGTRAWTSWPGEGCMSLTDEPGGLWRDRGHAPNRYVGVGMTAQGFDRGCGYTRTPLSRDPAYDFVFAGVSDDIIGDIPALSLTWGAAGYEVDRADFNLGTPGDAAVLATARDFTDQYQLVIEECRAVTPFFGGRRHPDVRADMLIYTVPGGGSVFSVGSINWASCLSWNDYSNNVSKITENVLRKFAGLR